MQNTPQTSFMPQQPLLRTEGGMKRKEPVSIGLVVALIVFFVTLVIAGVVFFYHKQAVTRVADLSQQLEEAEKLLNIEQIDIYKNINTRIDTARILIKNHNVFSSILNLLEESTATNIVLTSLSYGGDDKGAFVLSLGAQGPSYESAYFQGETWKKMKPMVSNAEISAVSLAEDSGVVTFTTKITINPEYTRYSKLLNDEDRIRKQQEQAAAAAASQLTPKTP